LRTLPDEVVSCDQPDGDAHQNGCIGLGDLATLLANYSTG